MGAADQLERRDRKVLRILPGKTQGLPVTAGDSGIIGVAARQRIITDRYGFSYQRIGIGFGGRKPAQLKGGINRRKAEFIVADIAFNAGCFLSGIDDSTNPRFPIGGAKDRQPDGFMVIYAVVLTLR